MDQNKIVEAINLLVSLIGKDRVRTEKGEMTAYSRDIFMPGFLDLRLGKISHLPAAVCCPESTEETARIVAKLKENRIPLIPFGAGSGVLGGTVPTGGQPAVIMDLKKMDKIRSVNKTNLTCEVEAGIIGEILERELNRQGFTLGHFPSSIYCSTLGGWLSTRSAGQFSAKYGKIEDMVLALEGVLPDGSVFRSRATPRSATGPDLDQVLVGAEGTLGVITAATLAIFPLPAKQIFRGFGFADVPGGLAAMRGLVQKELTPAALRLYDPVDTLFNQKKLSGPEKGCLLVVGYEGANAEMTALKSELGFKLLLQMGGRDLGEAPGLAWLKHRYAVSYNMSKVMYQPGNLLDTIEVSVVWRDAQALYQKIMDKIGRLGLVMAHFSHAWRDGVCIYFSFMVNDPGADQEKLREKHGLAWAAAMESCLEMGASISHHHGIGSFRSQWLKKELGPGHELLRRIKQQIDPANIFNPGKLGLGEPGS
jgi:alkyldihydroxyacetonephosphate synthase